MRMQTFDPAGNDYDADRHFSKRTRLLFLLYGLMGLSLALLL